MPPGTQSKILRVLVDQQFSASAARQGAVDLRVISSTTRDLEAEIAAGGSAGTLPPAERGADRVPSLADRREDIPSLLAEHFIEHFNRTQGLPLRDLLAKRPSRCCRRCPGPATSASCERDRTRADPGRRDRPDRGRATFPQAESRRR
jgi:DNA-binding NtrC family response regulator